MTNNTFCTIVTADFLAYALALHESLQKYDQKSTLQVLVVDNADYLDSYDPPQGMTIYRLDQISSQVYEKSILEKYGDQKNKDALRWSLKSVFLIYLMKFYDKVICVDCDINFFGEFQFLFDMLDEHNVLLTPHWTGSDPRPLRNYFFYNFIHGIFNAGFVGINKDGVAAMKWWAKGCLNKCEVDTSNGHFVDQTYLSLLPVLFEGVHIVKHKGCNVAGWNYMFNKRMNDNGMVKSGGDPIIFVHFAPPTFDCVKSKIDHLLEPFVEEYLGRIDKYKRVLQSENAYNKY